MQDGAIQHVEALIHEADRDLLSSGDVGVVHGGPSSDSAPPPDPETELEEEENPVLLQLIESSRDMRRRAMRAASEDDKGLRREEFVNQLGIAYSDTIDPDTGVSCLDVSDADRAYYGHRDDAAFTAYRQSLVQLLDDLRWLKRERFVANSTQEDVVLMNYIQLQVAYPSAIAKSRRGGVGRGGGNQLLGSLDELLSDSLQTATTALRRAKELADLFASMVALQGSPSKQQLR
jgi:hypothetical protein